MKVKLFAFQFPDNTVHLQHATKKSKAKGRLCRRLKIDYPPHTICRQMAEKL